MTSRSNRSHLNRHDDNDDDEEWLFESIVAFLSSPIWSAPIQQFFEANCSLFGPDNSWSGGSLLENDDEDMSKVPIELIDVHIKYKDLVDTLIKSFLQDIGVSYSQFTRACKNSSRLRDHPVYLELFEQVWCADNFKLFKAQMVRKNVELELQALILLQYQLGIIRSDGSLRDNASGDDEIMAIVIRKSKDEYDSLMRSRQFHQQQEPHKSLSSSAAAATAVVQKPQDLETAKKLVKSDRLVEELKHELHEQDKINRIILKEELSDGASLSTKKNDRDHDRDRPTSSRNRPQPSNVEVNMQNMRLSDRNEQQQQSRRSYNRDNDDDYDIVGSSRSKAAAAAVQPLPALGDITHSILAQTSKNLDPAELERRAEFMRRQRDLLNEKKTIERQRQLDAFLRDQERDRDDDRGSNESAAAKRPMSSRAARAVLAGADPTELQQQISSSRSSRTAESEEERKKLEARRALAETLKREVINKSDYSSSSRKN